MHQHRLDTKVGMIKRPMRILFLLSFCLEKLLVVTSGESLLGCHMSDASDMQGTRAGLPQVAFRAEPGQVLFRDCEVGQTYQQLVKLRNCTPIGQRLR